MAGAIRTRAALAGAIASIALATPGAGAKAADTPAANTPAANTPANDARTDGSRARFSVVMDSVFGAGKWRQTGGYRTPERENELRAQGALTVPVGVLSHHSMGHPDAPGAYDLVVDGVSPAQAAERLRRAGAPFRTLLAENAHGTQGPHLHVEPWSTDLKAAGPRPPGVEWIVKDATPAEQRVIALHARSEQGDADAQLRLGRLYAQGRDAPKDPIAAFVWTQLAAANGTADEATRTDAARLLADLAATMKPQDLAQARRFAGAPSDPAAPTACGGLQGGGLILVIGPDQPRPAEAGESCARSTGD